MKIYYFNSTHWDREWYYSKEAFRTYLVEMTNIMLDLLDDRTSARFLFRCQTIVLDDDSKSILSGVGAWSSNSRWRLKVGPW